MDFETFPRFAGGDVRLTVLPDIYQLHSSLLRNRSGALKTLLDRSQPLYPTLGQQGLCDTSVGFVRLNLVGSSVHKYGMLEVQRYFKGYDYFHCTIEEIVPSAFPAWPQKTRHVWANMLKIFHDIPPALDEGGYDLILENCQALVELGEDIQASDIVSRALSTALHSLDQQICRLITQDPVSWVKLAVHIQCGSVFQESMIHLVGKWGLLGEKDRNSLPVSIRDISNRKLGRLNEIKKAVELQIVNHVPRPRSSLNLHRETSNVYAWIAVTHYQQWLCQSFIEGRNYRAPDGGASLYRAIALGDAYLNKLGHAISPLPTAEIGDEGKRGLREFERGLNELKNSIKGFVSDLLANYAKYDPDIFGELPYLTCCQVREEEMPAKPETVKTIYKTAETRITNVNSNFMHGNNLQHNFLNDPMSNCVQLPTTMMGYRSHANNYYPTDGMQDHFGFDESNIMQQWGVNWTGTVGFSNAAPALPMPSLVDMTTGIYRTQLDEDGNFEEIDVFGIIPTAETEKNLQNDESVTFI